jgi:hypothetical protein
MSTRVMLDRAQVEAIVERTAARVNELVLANLLELQAEARAERARSEPAPPADRHGNREESAPPERGLVDAQTLARALGCSRDCVYAHADELGGQRIGAGPRGRLRFDLNQALAAWTFRSESERSRKREVPAQTQVPRRTGPRRTGSDPKLLPIRGPVNPVRADSEGS